MVTGSHNPPEFNGLKVSVGKTTIFGEEIQNLRRLIEKGEFSSGKGNLSEIEIIRPYQKYIRENIRLNKKMRVVIDAGNGTAGVVAGPLLRDLGCEVEELYCEIDGRFPNHFPDPTIPKNLEDLIDRVKKSRADVGIGYDGDGDRIGVVDDMGNIIWGDQLMILFSREILKEKKGATFIAEVKCSQNLFNDIEKHGGRAIMWKTGHSLIKEKMREEKGVLGGEMSGHIFFADRYFGYDDAIYASCRLVELLSKTDQKLSQLLDDVPKTFITPEIRVDCPDEIKFKVVERVKDDLRKDYPIIDVDGVRVKFDDGWGLVRASNTQPALVLRFEALTERRLQEIKELVEKGSSLEGNKKDRVMMSLFQAIFLGIVQGLTEFLLLAVPGIFFQSLFGMEEPQLFFDVMLHLGTLLAVVVYFRSDIWENGNRRSHKNQPQVKLFLRSSLQLFPRPYGNIQGLV